MTTRRLHVRAAPTRRRGKAGDGSESGDARTSEQPSSPVGDRAITLLELVEALVKFLLVRWSGVVFIQRNDGRTPLYPRGESPSAHDKNEGDEQESEAGCSQSPDLRRLPHRSGDPNRRDLGDTQLPPAHSSSVSSRS